MSISAYKAPDKVGDTKDDCEKLFLLEVLVESLYIAYASLDLDRDLLSKLTETCVQFQFLHYPPLVVCDSDFLGTTPGRSNNEIITFKSGKSCFFSLRSPRGRVLPVPFDVNVSIIRKLQEGMLPDKLVIGKTSINMTDAFTELLNQNTDENCDALPLSRTKKGTFDINSDSGRSIGKLSAFLRLSCFGKLIITQFSLSQEDKESYLFKGTDMKNLCQMRDSKTAPPINVCKVGQDQNRPGMYKAEVDTGSDWTTSDQPANEQRLGRDVQGQREPMAAWPPGAYNAPRTPARDNYYTQADSYGMQGYSSAGGYANMKDCGCPIDFTCSPGGPPRGMRKTSQRTNKNLDLAPGQVGLQDDQVIFQLPLKKPGEPMTEGDKQIDSSVYYKLTSSEETKEGRQKNTVHVKSDDLPGMAAKGAVGPVSGLPVDDGHDVFLLKIGKKCDGDKKRNLELELRTPKMKEPKPLTSNQSTQYLETDIPKDVPEGKGKGKKGKKGSKGGKGKGKKGGRGKKK